LIDGKASRAMQYSKTGRSERKKMFNPQRATAIFEYNGKHMIYRNKISKKRDI